MWFGPLWMIVWLGLVAVIVAMVRWLGEKAGSGGEASAERTRYS